MVHGRHKKILIVVHGFPPADLGGTEIYTYNLAKHLSERGLDVSVFTRLTNFPPPGAHSVRENCVYEEFDGIKVFRAPHSPGSLRGLLHQDISYSFERIVDRTFPDIIHFQHLVFLSADIPLRAFSRSIPSVMTFHDYWFICPRVQLLNKDNRICEGPLWGANCAFCFSPPPPRRHRPLHRIKKIIPSGVRPFLKKVKQDFEDSDSGTYTSLASEFGFRLALLKEIFQGFRRRLSPSRHLMMRLGKEGFKDMQFSPLGIHPIPRTVSRPGKKIRLGYMGNINYPKGLAIAIKELFPLLKDGRLELLVYGQPYDMPYFNSIKAETAQLPPENIRFFGRYNNTFESLWSIFSGFDALLFPSVWEENSPIVVREALLAGKPVIASDLGGIPEIVRHEVNGLVFNPFLQGDLRGTVEKLIEDRDLLVKLCETARSTDIPDMENHTDSMILLYEDVLRNK